MQLTEDGRAYHARARDLLADFDDLQSMFAGDRVALRGRLRVDLPTEVARSTIVPALPEFMAAHPELELEVSSTDRHVDLVQEGFDCALRLGSIRDETLIARPLGFLRMVNAASPAYLARFGVPRSLEDWHGDGYAVLPLPGALHVNSAQTYEAAAIAGLGLIQAPLLGIGGIWRAGRWSRSCRNCVGGRSPCRSSWRIGANFRAGCGRSWHGSQDCWCRIWSSGWPDGCWVALRLPSLRRSGGV